MNEGSFKLGFVNNGLRLEMLAIDDPHRFVGRARNYLTRAVNDHWTSPKKIGQSTAEMLFA